MFPIVLFVFQMLDFFSAKESSWYIRVKYTEDVFLLFLISAIEMYLNIN